MTALSDLAPPSSAPVLRFFMKRRARPFALALALAATLPVTLSAATSRAAERADEVSAANPEDARAAEDARPQRPWLYVDDPSLAAPLRPVAISALSVTASGASPTRPFASNVAHPGGAYELGAEVGLLPRLSVTAIGVTDGVREAGGVGVGMLAGVRVALIDASHTHLTLSAGYLRELSDSNGAWMRAAFAQDVGRARLAVTGHGEHIFSRGRDALDVMVMAGASYGVIGPLRAGVEYVAQDIEGAFDDEEVEGVRHFLGPNVALELDHRRLYVTLGPAVGLSRESPRLLGRLAVAYSF